MKFRPTENVDAMNEMNGMLRKSSSGYCLGEIYSPLGEAQQRASSSDVNQLHRGRVNRRHITWSGCSHCLKQSTVFHQLQSSFYGILSF